MPSVTLATDSSSFLTVEDEAVFCLTVIDANFTYDVSEGQLPVLTTKKLFWKPAIAEMLGYLRGYTSAAQFRKLGCNTWNANANENEAWLNNPYRKGEDDMGECYGAQARKFHDRDGNHFDQLKKIVNNVSVTTLSVLELFMFFLLI